MKHISHIQMEKKEKEEEKHLHRMMKLFAK